MGAAVNDTIDQVETSSRELNIEAPVIGTAMGDSSPS